MAEMSNDGSPTGDGAVATIGREAVADRRDREYEMTAEIRVITVGDLDESPIEILRDQVLNSLRGIGEQLKIWADKFPAEPTTDHSDWIVELGRGVRLLEALESINQKQARADAVQVAPTQSRVTTRRGQLSEAATRRVARWVSLRMSDRLELEDDPERAIEGAEDIQRLAEIVRALLEGGVLDDEWGKVVVEIAREELAGFKGDDSTDRDPEGLAIARSVIEIWGEAA